MGQGLRWLRLIVILCLSAGLQAGAAETRFTIVDSSPTSWVGHGYKAYTVSPDVGWTFTVGKNVPQGVDFTLRGSPLPGTTVDQWNLHFAAPANTLITPGVYSGFARWPFSAEPGYRLWK